MNHQLLHIHTCERPVVIRNRYTGRPVEVPCGTCPSCLLRKNTRYLPRIYNEATHWRHIFFVTLTYNNDNLPVINLRDYEKTLKPSELYRYYKAKENSLAYIKLCKGEIPFCRPADVQKFNKRLRQNIARHHGARIALRYFVSRDYGTTSFRPHWHGLYFFNSDSIAQQFESLVRESWSVQSCVGKSPIGFVDVQEANSAGRYVAAYTNAAAHRPPLLDFGKFNPRCLFSSAPSFGSLVAPVESPEQIVNDGLVEVTLRDPISNEFKSVPLYGNLVYRLFPTIPSFGELANLERYKVYNAVLRRYEDENGETYFLEDFPAHQRRTLMRFEFLSDSFLFDYLTRNDYRLTGEQITRKLDTIYYTVRRLWTQSQALGFTLERYDECIEKYLQNKAQAQLKRQFEFEQELTKLRYTNEEIDSIVDVERPLAHTFSDPQKLYFKNNREKYLKTVKSKLNTDYLVKHPEFLQFHKKINKNAFNYF